MLIKQINNSVSMVSIEELPSTGSVVDDSPPPWVRPIDWLPIPTPASSSTPVFYGLLGIQDDQSNVVALLAQGAYTVNWGDGTIENVATNTKAEHQYIFANISAGTETTEGYRQVIVTVTPQIGQNLTNVSLHQRHSASTVSNNVMWLDVFFQGPNLTQALCHGVSGVVSLRNLQRVRLGPTSPSFVYYSGFCRGLTSLQNFEAASTATGNTFSLMFFECSSLVIAPELNMSANVTTDAMFQGCKSLVKVPDYLTSSLVTSMGGMFQGCSALKKAPALNTSNALNIQQMYYACSSLVTVPQMNLIKTTSLAATFTSCSALEEISWVMDTRVCTNFESCFQNCYALKSVPSMNMSKAVNAANLFSGCSSLRGCSTLNTTSLLTNASGMFANCIALENICDFDTSGVTQMGALIDGCSALLYAPSLSTALLTGNTIGFLARSCVSLREFPAWNFAGITTFTGPFSNCPSLSRMAATGIKYSIDLGGCRLSTDALVEIFNNLGTAVGSQTITITGNYGAAALTAPQRAIATGKGWSIAG
jgi:hypothetical protein